jgi:hypothetical protein
MIDIAPSGEGVKKGRGFRSGTGVKKPPLPLEPINTSETAIGLI